jgi:hypothetical protein
MEMASRIVRVQDGKIVDDGHTKNPTAAATAVAAH